MDQIKIGMFGVGHLGKHHARILNKIPTAQLVGVNDVDVQRGEEIAERENVPFYADWQELLEQCEAVDIATPTFTHHELAVPALQAGKHVFVEKPMTLTVDQADDLIRLAKENQVTLQVGHIERFNSAMMELKRIMGRPLFIEVHRLTMFSPRVKDIGVVVDLMIHDLDLVLSLMNSEVARVDAVGVPVLTQFEDIANARVSFTDGCVANLTASRVSINPRRRIRIFQRDCYFSLDFQKEEIAVFRKLGEGEERTWGDPMPGITHQIIKMNREEDALTTELTDFLDCVREGRRPVVSGEDGRKALALAIEVTDEAKRCLDQELARDPD